MFNFLTKFFRRQIPHTPLDAENQFHPCACDGCQRIRRNLREQGIIRSTLPELAPASTAPLRRSDTGAFSPTGQGEPLHTPIPPPLTTPVRAITITLKNATTYRDADKGHVLDVSTGDAVREEEYDWVFFRLRDAITGKIMYEIAVENYIELEGVESGIQLWDKWFTLNGPTFQPNTSFRDPALDRPTSFDIGSQI